MKSFPSFGRGLWAAPILAAALVGGTVQAAPLDFDFTSSGFTLPSSCGTDCLQIGVSGSASASSLNIAWADLPDVTLNTKTGVFSGNWDFQDLVGNDELSGTFIGHVLSATPSLATGAIDYLVTGGTGLFAGATGKGTSTVSVLPDFTYSEQGKFALNVAPVPEPSTWALMSLGLIGVGYASRRRRPAKAD